MVSVSVGNTSPKVLGTDGSLIVGWVDEDSEDTDLDGVEFVGSVCTDLWWTTIVERGRLVDIVAETLGREEAERKVAAYLEENESNFDAVKVEPGTYHLYFSGSERDFKDGFKPANLKVGKGIEPFFVLANRPLTLDATADASPPEPLP